MTIGLASAIAIAAIFILTSNITIINAQEFIYQPGEVTQNGTIISTTILFENRNDSFRVQVPEGWTIDDLNNTGSALESELTQGYGILAELCPEEEGGGQQQEALPMLVVVTIAIAVVTIAIALASVNNKRKMRSYTLFDTLT